MGGELEAKFQFRRLREWESSSAHEVEAEKGKGPSQFSKTRIENFRIDREIQKDRKGGEVGQKDQRSTVPSQKVFPSGV